MAENESLDVGGAYAQRWSKAAEFFRRGASTHEIAPLMRKALRGGLAKALRQFERHGTSLGEFVANRHDQRALMALVRKAKGHQYARLFAGAARTSGPSVPEYLRECLGAILDSVIDRMCHSVVGPDSDRTIYEVIESSRDLRQQMDPEVDRIAAHWAQDPGWKPTGVRSKAERQADPTAELLRTSLRSANP